MLHDVLVQVVSKVLSQHNDQIYFSTLWPRRRRTLFVLGNGAAIDEEVWTRSEMKAYGIL